jgi:PGF-pre-PGF domain-containing protein
MNKTKFIKNGCYYKKIKSRKLSVDFMMILLILGLLCIPSVASLTALDGPDGGSKTIDSDSKTSVTGDEPVDKSTESTVSDETSTSSDTGSAFLDDTNTDSSSSTNVLDEKSSYDSNNLLLTGNESKDYVYSQEDNKSINAFNDSSLTDENVYNGSNERVVSEDEIVSISENKLGYLSSGMEKEIIILNFEDMESVKFVPSTDLEEVNFTIIKLKDKPEEIIDPSYEHMSVYKYLDIKLTANDTYIDEDEVYSLEFKFKVEKTWINNYTIDKETIKLIRYHDGIWQNLSTTFNSENETCIYYTASSPGFSTYAVVGSTIVENNLTYGTGNANVPWLVIFAFIVLLTMVLVFVLFKARYIYLKDDNN